MKSIITAILITFFPIYSFAGESCQTRAGEETAQEKMVISTDVPSHLKGAKIIVKLADGRTSEVPAELFKVVPRKQQYLVTKTKQSSTTTCTASESQSYKNRISLLGGEGPNSKVDVERSGNQISMESKSGTVGGVQYQRNITDRISVGAQVQSNDSALLSVGFDF
jgi:hypothetical protein